MCNPLRYVRLPSWSDPPGSTRPDGAPLFLHRTIDKHEEPYALNWLTVAVPVSCGPLDPPAFQLDRIRPDDRGIKARIVPRTPRAVKVVDFDEYIPRGAGLRSTFAALVAELRGTAWLREAASSARQR